ncbi:Rieske (2Fe-2S) protein [Nocardioides montaniterrae]
MSDPVSRRKVVALAGAGAALPLVAACGSSPSASSQAPKAPASSPSSTAPKPQSEHVVRGAQPALASTSDVPVGGALVLSDQQLVVTQPKAGEFRCFSSVCTHAGCAVRAGSVLECPCHGSEFSITDGSVVRGPADQPLPARKISVGSGQIRLA